MDLLGRSLGLVEGVNVELGEVRAAGHLVVGEEEHGALEQHPLQLRVLLLAQVSANTSSHYIITTTWFSPEVQSPVHLVGFIVIVVLDGAFQFGQNPLRATSPRGHDNISGI